MTAIARTDLDVFPLNLGGNTFGWTSDRSTSFAVLDAFTEAGGNFVDTADVYSAWGEGHTGGESETVLGEWLAARGNRDDVVLATKVGSLPQRPGLGRENVVQAIEESLRRLGTDRVDLYYAHRDDESVPVAEQAATFDELVRSGKVRAVGLSNYSPERLREWFETAEREHLTVPVAIQPEYNLVGRRSYEQDVAPVAREFGAAVFPYYGLASGFLTGTYRTAADVEGRTRGAAAGAHVNEEGLAVVDALVDVAEAHGVEPATVALAWLLAKGVTAPIASASRPEQVPALMAAPALALTGEEVEALDRASQPFA